MSEPIHIISLGAGVQSSTMALMAAKGEITPMPKAAIFADTQAEPASVYKWLGWLTRQLPFPVVQVTKGNLMTNALRIRTNGKTGLRENVGGIPFFLAGVNGDSGPGARRCTTDFKLDPLLKKAREIGGIKRGQKTVGVISWIGISVDEIMRMKPSRQPWAQNRWPLTELGMNRHDCLAWMKKNGYPAPPRSACFFCPYHSNSEWRKLSGRDFQRAVRFEIEYQAAAAIGTMRAVPYLHRSLKPLSDVDLSTEEERGQINMFNNECEGMCGV